MGFEDGGFFEGCLLFSWFSLIVLLLYFYWASFNWLYIDEVAFGMHWRIIKNFSDTEIPVWESALVIAGEPIEAEAERSVFLPFKTYRKFEW